ncbi:MAG: trehalase-like domain-containing protein, partial [Bacteroidota bacterium]
MNNLDYGIIGNCRSAALVSKKGSIDWCCLPQFDSASVFGKLLDEKIGGSFGFEVDDSYQIEQYYIENTVVLVTRFSNGLDAFEIRDFMPRYYKDNGAYHSPPEFIRYIKYLYGKPSLKVIYNPKLEYAIGETKTYIKNDFIVSLTDSEAYDTLFLYTDVDKEKLIRCGRHALYR